MNIPDEIKINSLSGMGLLTVTVKPILTREFKVRLWVAMRLLKLAGLVLKFGVNIEEET